MNIRQSYCNNTKGDVFTGPYCLDATTEDHFSSQKCRKIRDFNVDF